MRTRDGSPPLGQATCAGRDGKDGSDGKAAEKAKCSHASPTTGLRELTDSRDADLAALDHLDTNLERGVTGASQSLA